MPKRKLTDAEFLERIRPYLDNPNHTPTLTELGAATGLSKGGVYYKLNRNRITLKRRYVREAA